MFILPLVTLLGCTGSSVDVADYQLELLPMTPTNQLQLLESVAKVMLIIEPEVGEPMEFSLGAVASGEKDQVTGLPALDGAMLRLEARNPEDEIKGLGRAGPITLSHDTAELSILISQVEAFGWMGALEDRRAGGALVSDGRGRFLLFGGSKNGPGDMDSGLGEVHAFDAGHPNANLAFTWVGTMPPLNEDLPDVVGRVGHTATLLTGQHADTGKILVVGGSIDYLGGADTSDGAFLWNPESDTAEILGRMGSLTRPSGHHRASEDALGHVVISGGNGAAEEGFIQAHEKIWIYDPTHQEMRQVTGSPTSPLLFHESARLAADGVLLCGGITLTGGSGYTISSDCDLVSPVGEVDPAMDLPIPLMHFSMTTLADGRVLAIGGFTASGTVSDGDLIPATAKAYIHDGASWAPTLGTLQVGRGNHAATLMADGRVLIVGGATQTDSLFWRSLDSVACAELFDPASESFTLVDACNEDSASASLPEPTSFPMIATAPEHGVLIVGGMSASGDERPLDQALLFVPHPG
jgi:hypothetical protein